MTNEEQILAGIEEISNQLNEVKRQQQSQPSKGTLNEEFFTEKFQKIGEQIKAEFKFSGPGETELSQLRKAINYLQELIVKERNQVEHKYIEIKKPLHWIVGIAFYFLVSVFGLFMLYETNSNLKAELSNAQENDIKYRFLKIYNEPLSNLRKHYINNTTDIVYWVDDNYDNDPTSFKDYVFQQEENIRRASEAAELAKQKEIEAKAAKANAEKLKSSIK